MSYYHYSVGSLSGVLEVKDQKEAVIQAVNSHLELPHADSSYIPEIRTEKIDKTQYNKFLKDGYIY